MTDAFFGASPVVASALGIRSGATPRGPIHITTPLRNDTLKPDISTLPELGHFYFALTGRRIADESYIESQHARVSELG